MGIFYLFAVYFNVFVNWIVYCIQASFIIKEYVRLKMRGAAIRYLDICSVKHYRNEILGNMCEIMIRPPNTIKTFKITFRKNRTNKFISFLSGSEDITDNILIHMGPGYNFYGIPTTPRMLGYNSSIIGTTYDNKDITFDCDDIIC